MNVETSPTVRFISAALDGKIMTTPATGPYAPPTSKEVVEQDLDTPELRRSLCLRGVFFLTVSWLAYYFCEETKIVSPTLTVKTSSAELVGLAFISSVFATVMLFRLSQFIRRDRPYRFAVLTAVNSLFLSATLVVYRVFCNYLLPYLRAALA